jgi:hypothetical protein
VGSRRDRTAPPAVGLCCIRLIIRAERSFCRVFEEPDRLCVSPGTHGLFRVLWHRGSEA